MAAIERNTKILCRRSVRDKGKNTQSAVNYTTAKLNNIYGAADFGMMARPYYAFLADWDTPKIKSYIIR